MKTASLPRRKPLLFLSVTASALGLTLAVIVFQRSLPVELTFHPGPWPALDLPRLDAQLQQFQELHPQIILRTAAGKDADVSLLNTLPGGTAAVRPWRLSGWKIYTRLETLASFEGSGQGPWILPLDRKELTAAQWDSLEESVSGLIFLGAWDSPEARRAWEIYSPRVPGIREPFWYGSPQKMASDLEEGKLLFCLWNDSLFSVLPATSQPSYRGYAVPGSRTPGAGVFYGSVWYLAFDPAGPRAEAARELVKFLTSQGVARTFSRTFNQEFLWWPPEAVDQELPEVPAPETIIPES